MRVHNHTFRVVLEYSTLLWWALYLCRPNVLIRRLVRGWTGIIHVSVHATLACSIVIWRISPCCAGVLEYRRVRLLCTPLCYTSTLVRSDVGALVCSATTVQNSKLPLASSRSQSTKKSVQELTNYGSIGTPLRDSP